MPLNYSKIIKELNSWKKKDSYSASPYFFCNSKGEPKVVQSTIGSACYASVRTVWNSGDLAFVVPQNFTGKQISLSRETATEFQNFLLSEESPWSKYLDILFPEKSLIVDDVDVFSDDFRSSMGMIFPHHESLPKNLMLNFCKAYRQVGEHRVTIENWKRLVDLGIDKRKAYWFVNHFKRYDDVNWINYGTSHSVFNYHSNDSLGRYYRITRSSPDETRFIPPSKTSYEYYPMDCIWDTTPIEIKGIYPILPSKPNTTYNYNFNTKEIPAFLDELERIIS